MFRFGLAAVCFAILTAPTAARADDPPGEDDAWIVGGWFGPRLFSGNSVLGYIDGESAHPMLDDSISFGARASRQFGVPWLYPEVELAMSPTRTNAVLATSMHGAADAVTVFWLEPRAQVRIEPYHFGRITPFVFGGAGAPISISTARKTFNSGIIGDGYIGGGVKFDTGRRFDIRIDMRLAFLPGVDPLTGDNRLAVEGEIGFGVDVPLGRKPKPAAGAIVGPPGDRDNDGIPDETDKCPDRPEDKDGFEDADGCPDIDNDNDRVLDIADQCPDQPETYNGYMDEDGCPDTVPPDVEALRGTIEGLLYGEAETGVGDAAKPALAKIAKELAAQPSVKIVLVGYTDDREAKELAPPPTEGQAPPDLDTLSTELAHGRAEAVKQALVAIGVPSGRIVVEGAGAEDPVADNATPKGRLANRRVEVKLFVPPH